MPSISAHRPRRALLAALLVSAAACGRLTQPAASGTQTEPPVEESSATAPTFRAWTGGDPTWSLSQEASDLIIFAYTNSFIPGGRDDPTTHGYPPMPESCNAIDPEHAGGYPEEECLYPVLRELGVSEDAIRYYDETNGSMVLGLAGDGPVKIAHIWWGPFGPNDYPAAEILTPMGFMMATPSGWAPYAAAEEAATTSDVFPRIIAATGEGTPYSFVPVYPWQIHEAIQTATGWAVTTTSQLSGTCHACRVEFAGRFVLEFSPDGKPTGARFDGFCAFASEALDGIGQRVEGADAAAIAELKAELPVCEPARWGESVIDWASLRSSGA